jgi:hypothetical protein
MRRRSPVFVLLFSLLPLAARAQILSIHDLAAIPSAMTASL